MSHHFVSVSTLPAGGEKLDLSRIGKWTALLRLGAIAGLVLSAVLFVAGGAIKIGSKDFVSGEAISYTVREAFSYSWLFAFYVFFTLALGGLFWTLLHNASNSSWGVVIRRLPETLAVQFVPLLFLGLPLLFPQVRETLWTWMHDHSVAAKSGEAASLKDALHHSNHLLYHKLNYLTLWWGAVPGFIPRFFIYFLLLSVGAYALRGWSVSQDTTGDVRPTLSARRFSCGWLPLFAISLTFAGFDWIKGLNYAWFSTMFGVNVFAGSAVASMALLIVITVTLFENGYLKRVLTAEHLHLMGKLMHAFTIFWAYIAFSQYFLIWYANIAEETQFYAIRNTGGWNSSSTTCRSCSSPPSSSPSATSSVHSFYCCRALRRKTSNVFGLLRSGSFLPTCAKRIGSSSQNADLNWRTSQPSFGRSCSMPLPLSLSVVSWL